MVVSGMHPLISKLHIIHPIPDYPIPSTNKNEIQNPILYPISSFHVSIEQLSHHPLCSRLTPTPLLLPHFLSLPSIVDTHTSPQGSLRFSSPIKKRERERLQSKAMCNKTSAHRHQTRANSYTSSRKRKERQKQQQPRQGKQKQRPKQTTLSPLKQPSRKIRTKTRKPKFLSLNLQLSSLQKMTHQQQQQLNLFPLHPENLVEDKDIVIHDDHVASFLFDDTATDTTTLYGLLSTTTTTATTTTESDVGPLSPSLTFGGGDHHDHDVVSLVRTAMKGKERDESEQRWVSYDEVVEKKEEEVASCGVVGDDDDGSRRGGANKRKLLALKLDYEEILNAWSDKGPLYVEGESAQIVPDLHDDDAIANIQMDGLCSVGNLWRVPELGDNCISSIKMGEKENCKMGQREASVLRYKEKRHNRLFSKRIRYEVRKLNAEKRPRLKGRFVKRSV
ncbi:CCT domain-containing protein [Cephalotus follicularis]|uniref:CCT domain-containing protein n=1 Tax=Cephalotus follicularis TaxID=3775 RepID=A0A1Q3CXP8_CEPFO|nr:CCT domain-containing protein [Cephalotus follicularis]